MKLESYFTTLGSLEEQNRLDIIANNIANSNSPGFKKDALHFSDVLGEVTYTSMSQGPIHETGNKLDIALSGDGFLSLQTDQGTVYTPGRKSEGQRRKTTGHPGRLAGPRQEWTDHRRAGVKLKNHRKWSSF